MVRSAVCLVCILLASASEQARAQEVPQSDLEEASSHFDRGIELIEEAAYAEAAVEFQLAYVLSKNDAVLYNLGMAYAAAGRPVDAARALWGYLERMRQTLSPAEIERTEAELGRQRARIGWLTLEREPAAVLLKLDGHELSGGALAPIPLSVGDHRIDASLPGYESVSRTVSVAGEQQVTLRISLRQLDPAPAAQLPIRCAIPDVTVSIDDRVAPRAFSSAPVRTQAGEHVVRFRREGYAERVLPVVLGAGLAKPVDCALRILDPLPPALAAKLDVRARVPDAKVLLDGQTPPRDGLVPVGRHRLTVTAPGFEPWYRDIHLSAGTERAVDVRLTALNEARKEPEQGAQTQRRVAYVLGAGGVLAGVAALAVYLSADARYGDWEDEDVELAALADAAGREPLDPQRELELMNRTDANNELLQSVWDLDTVALALAIGGGALLASGAVVLFTAEDTERPQAPSAQLELHGASLRLRAAF